MNWSAPIPAADVRALAPEACDAFDRVFSALATVPDPRIAELARRRIAMLLGLEDECGASITALPAEQAANLEAWPTSAAFSAADRSCLSFAEQFALDVSAVSATDRSDLVEALGPGVFGFVQALYVADQGLRLRAVTRQLFGSVPFSASQPAHASDLWPALETMMTAVVRLDALDPLTAELVRLRGARAHHCRICQSRRHAPVVARHGANLLEPILDVDRAELTAAQAAAVRLTDAILWTPARVPASVLDEIRVHFRRDAALEIVLDVVRNASNKIAVALDADAPAVDNGVEYFDVDPAGHYTYGLKAPAGSL